MDAGEPTLQPLTVSDRSASDRRRIVLRRSAYVVGVLLLIGAVWAAVRGLDGRGVVDVVSRAPVWLILAVLLMPGLNWVITSAVFWRLTSRYGKVPFGEMYALLGSAWLLNHLPMRPGLIGRIAYHKAVHGIALRHSSVVLVQALGCAGVASGVLLVQLLAVFWGSRGSTETGQYKLLSPVFWVVSAALVLAWLYARLWAARRSADSPRYLTVTAILDATALRYADALVWSCRYAVAFAIAGEPLGLTGAVAVALASQAAMLLPVQLGVREWVVGLTAAMLPATWFVGGGAGAVDGIVESVDATGQSAAAFSAVAPGLLADLIGRCAELVWAVPGGLICGWWLATRRKRNTAETHGNRAESGDEASLSELDGADRS